MNKRFELLAPGGDVESIKAAILAGADAVYCGLDKFNARNRAVNISFENLHGLVRLAHQYNCKIFITLNIIILESEIHEVIRILNKLVNIDIDGVILQDLGLFHIIIQHFPTLDVHASTQLNTHNQGQIDFLASLNASRVNLSRELNINEIKQLAEYGRERNVLMEVFVHGSYCIGFSGLCYISSARNGSSGNRGRCSQPCRDQYQPTKVGKQFPLNMKDNSAFNDIALLADAGVYSLKVEGRIKKPHYVYTVVEQWRQQIDGYCQSGEVMTNKNALYTVFNRDFSNSYLKGSIDNTMFIDNPRDHSVQHFSAVYSATTEPEIKAIKRKLYDDKSEIIQTLDNKIAQLDISKPPLQLVFSGQVGQKLLVKAQLEQQCFEFESNSVLVHTDKHGLNVIGLEKKFKVLAGDKYSLFDYDLTALQQNVMIPFKELSQLKEHIEIALNDGQKSIAAVSLEKLEKHQSYQKQAGLSVLINEANLVESCIAQGAELQFQLPSAMRANLRKMVALFEQYPTLVPYFPAILIDDDFSAALSFIEQVQPSLLVTNNTGIAYIAYQQGIDWVAGPQLNLTNSYALQCIEKRFNAKGAFISNEINKNQIRNIVRPDNFRLYYSIYHPLTLLTSRQCLFQQTVGCKIKTFDHRCLKNCKKHTSIINLNSSQYVIDKQKGDHNTMYNHTNYLNLDVLDDLPELFTDWFIDLRTIKTDTHVGLTTSQLIAEFMEVISVEDKFIKNDGGKLNLHQLIAPTTMAQYVKGL